VGIRISETGRVLSQAAGKFVTLTAEVWKGFNRDARLYTPPGEDSVPCGEDQIILVKIDGTGKYIAAGVLDVSRGAKPGEKIFYCREADGAIKAKISMLNDGSVKTEADGDITQSAKGAFSAESEKDMSLKSAAGAVLEAAKKALVKGADVELNGKVKATGGSFECGGSASPTGTGCLCAMPFCAFTGAPHTGNKAEGT
jgi:hypothetical protein